MARSRSLPDHVLTVRTYSELARFARAFADGHLNLLLLFGAAGLGKTRHVRDAVGDRVCWIDGSASAFGIYTALYEHRDQPVVLDDVDGLYRDHRGLRLLKSLCQTEPVKTVSWQTGAVALDRLGIPRQFTTISRVGILANRWRSLNEDVTALEDRGHVLYFDPTPLEIHEQAAAWFWDQEIFDFVADHLHLIERHSLRIYPLAWELKSAGLDWRSAVLSRCLSGSALEVAKLKADRSFASEEGRVRAFVAAGHGCRATYFSHAKKSRTAEKVSRIVLTRTEPPQSAANQGTVLDLLRERFGDLGTG